MLEELTKENEELERVIAHQQGTRTASATGPRTRSAGKLDVNELPEYKQGQAYEGKQQLFKVVRDDNAGAQSVRAPIDWALQDHRSAAGRFQESGADREETFAYRRCCPLRQGQGTGATTHRAEFSSP